MLPVEDATIPKHSTARFPVAFRSAIDATPYRVASAFVIFYLVMPDLGGGVLSPLTKYLFTAMMLACFILLIGVRPINLSPLFPLAPLLLSVAGAISFTYSVFVAPGTNTYSSALIPLLVVAMPLLAPSGATRTNSTWIIQYLFQIFTIGALCHVVWQAVGAILGWVDGSVYFGLRIPSFSGSLWIIYLMILSGLFRRTGLLALSIILMGLALAFRPTSTLAFAALFAAVTILFDRMNFQRRFSQLSVGLAALILIGNFATLESPDFTEALYSIEPMVKEQALSGESNNAFRLGVLKAAGDEMAQYSILVGKAFTGDVNVDPRVYLPWLKGEMAPIHSDFVIMLVQGGLIGYGLFACLFLGMARLCSKASRSAQAALDRRTATLFTALQAMNITFMIYISPQPTMQIVQYALPYLILVPVAVFLARSQSRVPRLAAPVSVVHGSAVCMQRPLSPFADQTMRT